MPITIYITVDFFHYYWDKPDERQLWLAVNANIKQTEDDVIRWVRHSKRGEDFNYELVRDFTCTQNMVTVNLPDNVDLQLTATDGAGNEIYKKINQRRIAVDIFNGERFASDNLDLRGDGNVEPIRLGPFVQAFNHAARQAERGQSDIESPNPNEPPAKPVHWDRLASIIDITQAGGARRRLRQGIADNVDLVDIMQLPFIDEPNVTVTNLHSLNGLMFKLGDADDIPSLKAIRGLTLTINNATNELETLDLAARQEDATFLERYFTNLSSDLDYSELKATWLNNISRRVYIVDTAMVFAHRQYPDGTHWYRRRREERKSESSDAPSLTLNEINRILVKYRRENYEAEPPADWTSIEWDVFASFECEMQKYREYAAEGTGVLRLLPRKQDAQAFFLELGNEPNLLTRAKLYDANGTTVNATYLGCFNFIWDRTGSNTDQVILYHGSISWSGNVTVVFQRLWDNGTPIRVTTARVREQDDFGDGEDYWQFLPTTPLPTKRFHHFKLSDSRLDEAADRLIVAVSFVGDVEFKYAQAASSIEAVIQTTIPRPKTISAESMRTIPDEFLDDLNNFNCLNIFHTWGTKSREHLNQMREDYPVFANVTDTNTDYTYHVRFEVPMLPDIVKTQSLFDARPFFLDLYDKIGTDRVLEFDAEHTYGTHIDLIEKSGVSADFDFPILLPSDVDNGEATPKHFLTVEYQGGENNKPENVFLYFDKDFLKPVSTTDMSAVSTHIAAWRSVAETAHAEQIILFGKFRRFDYRQSLFTGANNSFAAALAPVDIFDSMRWDVTDLLVPISQQWLRGDLNDGSSVIVLLTKARQPKIFRSCNVIEFHLEYFRASSKVPDQQGSWNLVREKRPIGPNRFDNNLFDKYGLKVVEVKAADDEYIRVRQRYEQFNLSLLRRSGPIKPNENETLGSILVRRVLGGGGGYDLIGASDWIVPEGPIDGTGRPAIAEFLPIGFRPIDQNNYFGQSVDTALRRAFDAIEAIIEGRTSTSRLNNSTALTNHFYSLDKISPEYEQLMEQLAALAFPLPDPEDDALNDNIKPLVNSARQPDHPITKAMLAQLVDEFTSEPTRFYGIKAYLYTRLRDAESGCVSPDLLNYKSSKLIRGSGDNAIIEHDSENVHASLSSLMQTEWFGFFEGLDDTDYDNEFYLTDVTLSTFEAAIDSFAKAEENETELPVGGSFTIPIRNNTISLPRGDQLLTGTPNLSTPVELASRKALSNPVLLFIGQIEQCQIAGGLDNYMDKLWDQGALFNGIITEAVNLSSPALKVVRTPLTTDRSDRRDDYTISVVYSISGDEEAAQGAWTNAFQNDTFIVDILADDYRQPDLQPEQKAVQLSGVLKEVLDQLMLQSDVAAIEHIETIVSHDAIEFLKNQVLPNVPIPISYEDLLLFEINEYQPDISVEICDVSTTPHDLCTEFFLLKPTVLGGGEGRLDDNQFYILLNIEVPVWQKTKITLVQGRNIGRRFAPEFGVHSETIVPQDSYSPSFSINLIDYPSVILQRSTQLSARGLIKRLLIDDISILQSESEADSDWTDFDLSISIFGDQRPEMPRAVNDGNRINDSEKISLPSKHGCQRYFFQQGDFDRKEINLLYVDYDHLLVEFQWITPSNQMIFRIENRRVKLQ